MSEEPMAKRFCNRTAVPASLEKIDKSDNLDRVFTKMLANDKVESILCACGGALVAGCATCCRLLCGACGVTHDHEIKWFSGEQLILMYGEDKEGDQEANSADTSKTITGDEEAEHAAD